MPDLPRRHVQERRGSSRTSLHTPLPQRGKRTCSGQIHRILPVCVQRDPKHATDQISHLNPAHAWRVLVWKQRSSSKWLCRCMERPRKPLTPNLAFTESDVSFWWVLKEARRLEVSAPRRGSDTAASLFRRLTEERRKSADGWISSKEQHAPRRQLSLRRHRWNLSEGRHLFLFSDSFNGQESLYFSNVAGLNLQILKMSPESWPMSSLGLVRLWCSS